MISYRGASVIGLLVNPANSYATFEVADTKVAADALGLQLYVVNAIKEVELDAALANLVDKRIGALLVGADVSFIPWRDHFIALAARYKLPISYGYRDFVAAGGLMSYSTNRADAYRHVGLAPLVF